MNKECLSAIEAYNDPNSKVYKKAYYRVYIEENFSKEDIEECKAIDKHAVGVTEGKMDTYSNKRGRRIRIPKRPPPPPSPPPPKRGVKFNPLPKQQQDNYMMDTRNAYKSQFDLIEANQRRKALDKLNSDVLHHNRRATGEPVGKYTALLKAYMKELEDK